MGEKIKVHEKALAHLSRGLYRSPASALRELISNAWDANATEVRVNTNYPNFYQVSVQDNGDGFTEDQFRNLMSGGIGNSEKRSEGPKLRHGREIIGRYGIGMLGIANFCGSFIIVSKTASGDAFKARVHLYDLAPERMDDDDPELVHEDIIQLDGEDKQLRVVNVGEFEILEIDPQDVEYGTQIVADDLHPTFTLGFQEAVSHEKFKPVPRKWEDGVKDVLSKEKTLQVIGDYWRFIWELACSCPVEYFSEEAVPDGLIADINKKLRSYNFAVFVDSRKIFKPVFLEGNADGYTSARVGPVREKVYGRNLRYEGYIVVQEGRQLQPDELRGILIRVKNIAVGFYDPSMLDYRRNEGPRSRWLTGEINVLEGMESALNVDRESFNRFHPQYRALQAHVHDLLSEEIFRIVYQKLERRSARKEKARGGRRDESLRNIVSASEKRSVVLKEVQLESKAPPVASVVTSGETIEIDLPDEDQIPTSKRMRKLAQAIIAIFEVAIQEKSQEAKRLKFSSLLTELLRKW